MSWLSELFRKPKVKQAVSSAADAPIDELLSKVEETLSATLSELIIQGKYTQLIQRILVELLTIQAVCEHGGSDRAAKEVGALIDELEGCL